MCLHFVSHLVYSNRIVWSRDRSVDIAMGYELDARGSISGAQCLSQLCYRVRGARAEPLPNMDPYREVVLCFDIELLARSSKLKLELIKTIIVSY